MRGTPGATRLVVSREIREALRRRAIWITALVTLLGATALMVVPELIGSDDDRTIVVVGQASAAWPQALDASLASTGLSVEQVVADDIAAARHLVDDGDADVGVVFGNPPVIISKDSSSQMVTVARQALSLDRAVTLLQAAGLDQAQIGEALSPAPARLDVIQSDRGGRLAAATVVSLGVYLLIFMITATVANAVAIEKANRVSEVLLAIVPPRSLLFGKVIGVGLVGVIPLACGAVPVVVKLLAGGSLPPGTGQVVASSAAWFVLGAALYLLMAAALGALVERQEEVGSAMAGLSTLLIASYVIGQSAADSPLGAALAYVPFSAPMVVPARLALGASSATEVTLSLAISVVAVVAAARLASVVYRRGIVRTGRRLRLHEVLRPQHS